MAKYNDEFNDMLDLDSLVIVNEDASAGMDDAMEFENVPLTLDNVLEFNESRPASLCSQSSSSRSICSEYLHNAERCNQLAVNSLPYFHQNVCAQRAFCKYSKANSMAAVNSFKTGHVLLKRCLGFLRKIEKERIFRSQISAQTASVSYKKQLAKTGFQKKATFDHMLAERNRRIKLRHQFSNLSSSLPQISKKDKHSILANTISYVKELKLRVVELEQQNQRLQQLVLPCEDEGGGGGREFESPGRTFEEMMYRSKGVTLEQCKEFPCRAKLKVSVEKDEHSCPATLLIKQLNLMKGEQLEVLSIQTHTQRFQYCFNILLRPNGQAWNTSQWQKFGTTLTQSL